MEECVKTAPEPCWRKEPHDPHTWSTYPEYGEAEHSGGGEVKHECPGVGAALFRPTHPAGEPQPERKPWTRWQLSVDEFGRLEQRIRDSAIACAFSDVTGVFDHVLYHAIAEGIVVPVEEARSRAFIIGDEDRERLRAACPKMDDLSFSAVVDVVEEIAEDWVRSRAAAVGNGERACRAQRESDGRIACDGKVIDARTVPLVPCTFQYPLGQCTLRIPHSHG
jgi:hypothetical protein